MIFESSRRYLGIPFLKKKLILHRYSAGTNITDGNKNRIYIMCSNIFKCLESY